MTRARIQTDRSPAFSADGRRILFVARARGESDLCVMNADGSGRRILARMAGEESAPCWAPDGRWLVFGATATANGRHDEIVRLRILGKRCNDARGATLRNACPETRR